MRYLINESNDGRYNLAFEEYCFKNLPRDNTYMYFWINGPTVVVGKNQNTIEQIDGKFIEEKDITVVRRVTGGGAVYHDLGNLNYSIIVNEDSKNAIDFTKYNKSILQALSRLGLDVELKGRNDIVIDGKKVSGIAQSISKGRVLNHGTLMFDVNMIDLVKALYVNKDKLLSKGIDSIRSRVTNIKEYLEEEMNIYEFRDILLEHLFDIEGYDMVEYKLSSEEKNDIQELYDTKYNTWEWNYGNSPKSEYKFNKRFKFGTIDIRFDIKEGIIRDINIFGDFFGSEDIRELEGKLEGEKYDIKIIRSIIENLPMKKYFGDIRNEEFLDLMF